MLESFHPVLFPLSIEVEAVEQRLETVFLKKLAIEREPSGLTCVVASRDPGVNEQDEEMFVSLGFPFILDRL
jgi:hypothetical protein